MIASAIISCLGTAASGFMSYINNKRSQEAADAEYARQIAYDEAKAAENPLARSENRALIGEYDRAAKKQVETERNRNKILGGTPEMDLAVQGRVAEGRASLLGGMAQQASQRADQWNQRAEEARMAKANADQERMAQRNASYAALAANAASAMSGLFADTGGKDWNQELDDLESAYSAGNSGLTEDQYNAAKTKINNYIATANQRRWK